MLKVYLDWNCITHSKDNYKNIFDEIKKYQNKVIFPYSLAHIRDLLVGCNEHTELFEKDLEILTNLCGKHFLVSQDDRIFPEFAYPQEVIKEQKEDLEQIPQLLGIFQNLYNTSKKLMRDYDCLSASNKSLKRISKENNPANAFSLIDEYLKQPMYNNMGLKKLLQDNIKRFSNTTFESQFKTECMALDIFGFRSEEHNKTMSNIEIDSSHIFMAAHCDILVTADKRMRDKAIAEYNYHHCVTKVITPQELPQVIEEVVNKELDVDYWVSCISNYGYGREEADGFHYKFLPSHVAGLFNMCYTLPIPDSTYQEAYFVCNLNQVGYAFYTEIYAFLQNIRNMLRIEKDKERFDIEYADIIKNNETEKFTTAKFKIGFSDRPIILELSFENVFNPNQYMPMMRIINKKTA